MAAGGRARARWITVLSALAAIGVGVAGARHALRFAMESRAIEALRSEDEAERREALRELAKLTSARAVPAILSTMPSDQKGARAIRLMELGDEKSAPWEALCSRAIQEIGLGAIPALRRALGSPDAAERFWSIVMLMRFAEKGRLDPDAALRSLLDDSDQDVCSVAAVAVGLSAAKNHRLLESLVTDLKGPRSSENLRISAASAIGIAAAPFEARMSFERKESAAALEEEKSVPSPEMTSAMRSAALALLEAAQSPSERSTFAIFEGLCAIERRCSFGDLNLKDRIHDVLRQAVPAVVAAAQGELPQLTAAAIEALAVISPEESIPLSTQALGHEDRGVRDAALTALWTVGSAASRALPALRRFREEEKDLDLAKRATTLVRRLEYEEAPPNRVRR